MIDDKLQRCGVIHQKYMANLCASLMNNMNFMLKCIYFIHIVEEMAAQVVLVIAFRSLYPRGLNGTQTQKREKSTCGCGRNGQN